MQFLQNTLRRERSPSKGICRWSRLEWQCLKFLLALHMLIFHNLDLIWSPVECFKVQLLLHFSRYQHRMERYIEGEKGGKIEKATMVTCWNVNVSRVRFLAILSMWLCGLQYLQYLFEVSQKASNGLPLNLVHVFVSPTKWTVITLVILCLLI